MFSGKYLNPLGSKQNGIAKDHSQKENCFDRCLHRVVEAMQNCIARGVGKGEVNILTCERLDVRYIVPRGEPSNRHGVLSHARGRICHQH